MTEQFVLVLPLANGIEKETIKIVLRTGERMKNKKKKMAEDLLKYLYTKAPSYFFDAFFKEIGQRLVDGSAEEHHSLWQVMGDYITTILSKRALSCL